LSRAGKKAALAAEQANDILRKLQTGGLAYVEAGAITKHGELRIKGCVKYDLGSGYRLVTLKQEMDLLVLYIGSHDDCHRWIENNRELPVDKIRQRSRAVPVVHSNELSSPCERKNEMMAGEKSEDFFAEPDDRQLRTIFSGLIQSVQSP
jgi:hypothetical protein